MFRVAIVRSSLRIARNAVPRHMSMIRSPIRSSLIPQSHITPPTFQAVKRYSASAPISEAEVQERIIDLLKNFDKVKADDINKISPTAHFFNDLGLDSLDTVEVLMAIEEEFSLEIPDKDADSIHSVDQAVKYIVAQPDAN
ncbi:Acyl carrier protein, mitochondrial [Erysiphe neolycopersici]|uniref:Acyl carrier protein n=1 Tax=Erysiphe neolycopersici TaxID=212602 RepID=A0A420HP47_9PEZI|nr:Acyl carrier protein, mitochondrial [Erysiphe neolycopersici]